MSDQNSMATALGAQPAAAPTTAESPRRTRSFRKRRIRVVPRMPWPVRALWEAASEEEKQRAHKTCALLLQLWLGRRSRVQAAQELGLTPLRVWQLSQQAVAGMAAGVLKQPKTRRKGGLMLPEVDPEEDPKQLKATIARLQSDKQVMQALIDLLRELPANQAAKASAQKAPATAAAVARGEEAGGVPGRKKKRPGTRKSSSGCGSAANRGVDRDGPDRSTADAPAREPAPCDAAHDRAVGTGQPS